MSSQSPTAPMPAPTPAAENEQTASRPRSLLRRIMGDVLLRYSARAGLVWISILMICAVFAPLIANSHPVLIKMDGQVSSPLLNHLTSVDVILLVMVPVALVLALLTRVSVRRRWFAFLGLMALTSAIAFVAVNPPELVVYDEYRMADAEGRVDWVINTPVPYSPTDRLRDQPGIRLSPPSSEHWMGVDPDGSDVLSRMIHASRIALSIGFIATGIAVIIGILIGGLMGYYAGLVDLLGMRLVEIFSSIPTLMLMLMFVAFFGRAPRFTVLGVEFQVQTLYLLMVIIGLTGWVGYAIFVRAEFFRLRKQDFVQAAVACGLPLRSILFRHMLPNGVTPVIVSASFGVASAILAESTLSFLGLGLVDEPSWGGMLNQALGAAGRFHWWIAVYPGGAIFLTVLAYNLVGESLRDALDPRLQQQP